MTQTERAKERALDAVNRLRVTNCAICGAAIDCAEYWTIEIRSQRIIKPLVRDFCEECTAAVCLAIEGRMPKYQDGAPLTKARCTTCRYYESAGRQCLIMGPADPYNTVDCAHYTERAFGEPGARR